jgi:hypothetical protein
MSARFLNSCGPGNRLARLRAITPHAPSDFQFRDPEQRELFLSVLRLAAGETN